MAFLPKHSLFDEFTLRGKWWHPSDPDTKVGGKLSWSPREGGRLELSSRLRREVERSWDAMLHGETHDRLAITLQNVITRQDNIFAGHAEFSATRLLCGIHIMPGRTYFLSGSRMHLSSLSEWYGHKPWNLDLEQSAEELMRRRKRFSYIDPALRVVPIPSIGGNLQFTGSVGRQLTRSKMSFNYDILLTADCANRPLEDWQDFVHAQSRLMTLLACSPAHPREIELEVRHSADDQRILGDSVKAYFRHEKSRGEHEQIGPNMPMQFPKVGHKLFRRAATRWFELHSKIMECLRLLFRQLEHSKDEIVPRFLNACQMFESFHRATRDTPYVRKSVYERWLKTMTAAIPRGVKEDHRESLKNKLKYGNQLSLRNRLRRTFESLPEPIRDRLEIEPRDDANKIARARNFYTHLDDSDGGSPVNERDLFPYSAKLVMTVGYLLWCDLGLAKKIQPHHVSELWMLA